MDDAGVVVRNCDVVELRVHGCDGDDVLITANSVPKACPPLMLNALKFAKRSSLIFRVENCRMKQEAKRFEMIA